MLTEGKSKGLKEEEIFQNNKLFIPTAQTPILNYLYFLLREGVGEEAAIRVLREADDLDRELSVLKEEFDKKYGGEVHKDFPDSKVDEVPNMVSFIYGKIGDDTMATLKKLKTLSMSENEKEAFVAFRKGHELCKKYSLEWDRIPINR